ncbi:MULTISPECIES: ABC transporter substrate-binding protein [Brevibacillus]|jgi:peptide/nickel transport system substrate-binding protein|uniref:Peptide ABC transporter substrate-binding protein n=1 Tax=Brevibacillus parabrevis TaxID=54914 RepID=A0A4Y3PLZ9_BREPA|nr:MULTISPECIES: ABC transporter substrate-binding protein [Brevibacillus]MBU8714321.1 ABC transporter substrate-binding protein [Brevibacillus parabrevis]MDH6351461.1 peptide/nickel transport system substrate-binding protein [Brevibacillus sp. 1238]MDR4998836.1 ABC transporter substrate-binding protein [Brevibacillus parabrevis]MED2254970.1 ABC transporter substrate-binding protein [Brevibacillus parabrevis]NRQ57085.1 ABC transporter substrate-binding protein [Brevibacillus sp. HD1.4A]
MKKSWWKTGPLSVLLATAVIAGCSSQTANQTTQPKTDEAGKTSNTLVVSSLIDPDTLDLHKTTWLGNENGLLYEPLLSRDTSGKIIPGLAEKYEISPDGKTWTFTIRKNIRFHTGNPVTAAAVKESFDRMLEISPVKGIVGPIEKVEATDEQTLKVHFSKPFSPFINVVISGMVSPVDTKAAKELGDGFGDKPSGTGPIQFEKRERGASLLFKKNPEYNWGPEYVANKGPLHIDNVLFRFLKDDDTRMMEFKKGTIHVLHDVPANSVAELQSLPGVDIQKTMDIGIKYIAFNNKHPLFSDVRLRKAVALSVDRDPLVQVALNGFGKPIYGPLAPTIFGYSEAIENKAKQMYTRNVAESKQLLADAGWTDTNNDGIVDKDGKPLSVEILVSQQPAFTRAAQILQSQLREAGIDLKITVQEMTTIKDRISKKSYDMALMYYGWYDADILFLIFEKSNAESRMHYTRPELDDLLNKGREASSEEERIRIYEQAQEILLNDSPWVPLWVNEVVTATRGIKGFGLNSYTQYFILNDVTLDK